MQIPERGGRLKCCVPGRLFWALQKGCMPKLHRFSHCWFNIPGPYSDGQDICFLSKSKHMEPRCIHPHPLPHHLLCLTFRAVPKQIYRKWLAQHYKNQSWNERRQTEHEAFKQRIPRTQRKGSFQLPVRADGLLSWPVCKKLPPRRGFPGPTREALNFL